MNWIDKIFEAIEGKCGIAFSYHNIYKQTKNQYQLFPYLLIGAKMVNSTMVGSSAPFIMPVAYSKNWLALKSLRRLCVNLLNDKSLILSNAKVKYFSRTSLHPITYHLFLCSFNKLVLLEPIHQSQQVIDKNNKELKITLNVLVNEEFYLKILSMGTYCIVNKPETLKKKIKEKINAMQKNYR